VRTYASQRRLQPPFDEDFCAKTRFGRLVAQGGLSTGLLHALVAMDTPGHRVSQPELEVHGAGLIGDTITAGRPCWKCTPRSPSRVSRS
jgi:acyl dehydratase